MDNVQIIQCPKCGKANEVAANKCAYCGTEFYQPLPIRYILFGMALGLLSALLVQETAIPLMTGVSRGIGLLAMSTAAGSTAFWLADIRYRQRRLYVFGSFIGGLFFSFLGVWRCWLPMLVFPGLLLLTPRIREATKRTRTVLLISYILFVELAVILILLRPSVFTYRPFPLWVSLPVAFLAVAFPLRVTYLWRHRNVILGTWPLKTAKVLSVNIKHYYSSEGTSEMQHMVLQYPVADEIISSATAVNTLYGTYKPGDDIKIRYDPDQPRSFIFNDAVSAPLNDALLLFPMLIWALLILTSL